MKMNIDTLSALIIAVGVPFFGLKLWNIGIPAISGFIATILLTIKHLYIKKLKFHYNLSLLLIFFTVLLFSTITSLNPIYSFKEVMSFLVIILFIMLIDYNKINLDLFFNILILTFFIRSSIELNYSFTHMSEWIGKYKNFMRFSVAHLGGDPNNLALLLIPAIVYILFNKKGILSLFLLIVFVMHFIMLFSRGAILALSMSIIFYAIWFKKKNIFLKGFLLIIVIICILYYLVINDYIYFGIEYLTGKDASSGNRLIYWKEALYSLNWKIFFLGNGPNTFIETYGHWLHNSYLNRFLELGIVGFLCYMLLLLYSWILFLKQKNYLLIIIMSFIIGSFFVDFYLNSLMWFFIGYVLKNSIDYKKVKYAEN